MTSALGWTWPSLGGPQPAASWGQGVSLALPVTLVSTDNTFPGARAQRGK